jgi:hypothetical protein
MQKFSFLQFWICFSSRRNFVQEAQKDEATSSHRPGNVWNPIDDLELVLHQNGNIQLHQILNCLHVFEINGLYYRDDIFSFIYGNWFQLFFCEKEIPKIAGHSQNRSKMTFLKGV